MSLPALATIITEGDPVRRWRSEQLQQAGYPPLDALILSARQDIDLHRALDLLAHGCPAETAVRILL